MLAGCASPAPPRPPSLHLPEPVRDLAARRMGDTVELSFTLPHLSTDKGSLRADVLRGTLCRQVERGPCVTVRGLTEAVGPEARTVTLVDALPQPLTAGGPRLLAYRVEFFNASGRSAGPSEAAYTAAGQAPEPVEGLTASGSRLGTVLRWRPAGGAGAEVLLRREEVTPGGGAPPSEAQRKSPRSGPGRKAPAEPGAGGRKAPTEPGTGRRKAPAEPGVLWLDAHGGEAAETLDASALPEVAYRYAALRERVVELGGRSLALRSVLSPPVSFTLQDVFPPPVPTGLTALGYSSPGGGYAVDLIWQPVDDAGLAGYAVSREPVDGAGRAAGARERLSAVPVAVPGFHDATAKPGVRYRYSVTALDARGNESAAASTLLEPEARATP